MVANGISLQFSFLESAKISVSLDTTSQGFTSIKQCVFSKSCQGSLLHFWSHKSQRTAESMLKIAARHSIVDISRRHNLPVPTLTQWNAKIRQNFGLLMIRAIQHKWTAILIHHRDATNILTFLEQRGIPRPSTKARLTLLRLFWSFSIPTHWFLAFLLSILLQISLILANESYIDISTLRFPPLYMNFSTIHGIWSRINIL